jgi:hypothetical protein
VAARPKIGLILSTLENGGGRLKPIAQTQAIACGTTRFTSELVGKNVIPNKIRHSR